MSSNIRIEKLILHYYRNHKFLDLNLEKNMILLCGKNGSGKTNILESISLLNSNTGLKKSNLKEIINDKLDGPIELFGVNVQCRVNKKKIKIGVGIKKNNASFKKILRIQSDKYNEKVENIINTFWIVPKMTFLFQNNSEDRRSFLDNMISSVDGDYKKRLSNYDKFKSERIKILKKWNNNQLEWVKIIEKKLASFGVIICDARRNFLKELNQNLETFSSIFPSLQLELSGELDKLLLKSPAVEVEDFFLRKLEENRNKDTLMGKTNFSVNKTDLLAFDVNSMTDARNFSTGEQKIIIFSIIFSFIKFLESKSNLNIIFLLDDVFSFLDDKHISIVLEKLHQLNVQTFLTDVKGDWILKDKKFAEIIHKINIDDKRFKVDNI